GSVVEGADANDDARSWKTYLLTEGGSRWFWDDRSRIDQDQNPEEQRRRSQKGGQGGRNEEFCGWDARGAKIIDRDLYEGVNGFHGQDPDESLWTGSSASLPLPKNDAGWGERLKAVREGLLRLRDAILIEGLNVSSAGDDVISGSGDKHVYQAGWGVGGRKIDGARREEPPGLVKNEGGMPQVWVTSPLMCPFDQHQGKVPHLVGYFTFGGELLGNLALSLRCQAHTMGVDAMVADTNPSWCRNARAMECVMMDVAHNTHELGQCTRDGSSGVSWQDSLTSFFDDPSQHCEGYMTFNHT
ncbi:unnamed protein product, partial [Discosporangium mesarthrocarpum]